MRRTGYLGTLAWVCTLTWGGLAALAAPPDLIIYSITPSDTTPEPGQNISVVVVVKNLLGTFTGPNFRVSVWYHSASAPTNPATADAFQSISGGIPGFGGTKTLTFSNVHYDAVGEYTFWAWADSYDEIEEDQNENNNKLSTDICVVPRAPTGVSASYWGYCDKVRVTWDSVSAPRRTRSIAARARSRAPGTHRHNDGHFLRR